MKLTHPHNWPKQGELCLQVEGSFALVTRPGHQTSVVTYPFLTPSLCRGLLKALYHNNYYFPVPTRLEILKPLKTVQIAQAKFRDLALPGAQSSFEVGRSPSTALYLQDVAYRIHYDIYGIEAKKFRTLTRRVKEGGSDSTLWLGTRECVAEVVPVDNTPPCSTFNAIEAHFMIGNRTMLVMAKQGVVDFPNGTFEALIEMRDQRMGLEGAVGGAL